MKITSIEYYWIPAITRISEYYDVTGFCLIEIKFENHPTKTRESQLMRFRYRKTNEQEEIEYFDPAVSKENNNIETEVMLSVKASKWKTEIHTSCELSNDAEIWLEECLKQLMKDARDILSSDNSVFKLNNFNNWIRRINTGLVEYYQ